MSFLQRDLATIPRAKLATAQALYVHFNKFWKTKTVGDGVEVYEPSALIYYGGGFRQDTVTKKFVKALGMSWEEFTGQSVDDEIETMSFVFKPGFHWDGYKAYSNHGDAKTPTYGFNRPTKQQIVDSINREYAVGEELKATIAYGGELKRYVSEHELEWVATGSRIEAGGFNSNTVRSILHSNPWYFFANSRHMPYSKDSNPFQIYTGNNDTLETYYSQSDRKLPVTEVYAEGSTHGVLAVLGDNNVFEVLLKDGEPLILDPQTTTRHNSDGETLRYQYSLSYTFKGCDIYSQLVKDIDEWFDNYYDDIRTIPIINRPVDKYKEELTTSTIDTKIKHVMKSMMVNPLTASSSSDPVEDSVYYYAPDGNGAHSGLVKVSALASMKKREMQRFLSTMIDVDYTVEKASWFEKALSLVIIVVSVVIAVYAAGAATGILAQVAAGASSFAVSITIGSMVLSAVGGLSAQGQVQMLGDIATMAGYVALVTGIMAAYQAFTTSVAKSTLGTAAETMGSDAIAQAASKVTVGDMFNFAVDSVKENISSVFTDSASLSFKEVVSYVGDGVKMLQKVNDYMMDKDMEELKAEEAQLEAEESAWNESLSNNIFKDGSTTLAMELMKVSEYDSISLIDLAKYEDSAVSFKTEDSRNWFIGVNS